MRLCNLAILTLIFLITPLMSFSKDCGDVNGDSTINIFDITYLISNLYLDGPDPQCRPDYGNYCVDVNSDSTVNIFDITHLISYLYMGGPEPICYDTIVTDIDSNVYKTIKIGDQIWMAENLKVTHYRNGDPIDHVTDDFAWYGLTTGAYCEYDNDSSNVAVYGRLYNWYAADDSRNIAPEGWHVPTDDEIKQLEMYLGMSETEVNEIDWRGTNEGSKLAGRADLWDDGELESDPEFGSSGFDLPPSGCCTGSFLGLQGVVYLWTATEYLENNDWAWARALTYINTKITRGRISKTNGYSIRCVKD